MMEKLEITELMQTPPESEFLLNKTCFVQGYHSAVDHLKDLYTMFGSYVADEEISTDSTGTNDNSIRYDA